MDAKKLASRTASLSPPQPTSAPATKKKAKTKKGAKQTRRKTKSTKRGRAESDESDAEDEVDREAKRAKVQVEGEPQLQAQFKQSSLVTGATLKDYQLEGVEWMVSLDSNGASGILGG